MLNPFCLIDTVIAIGRNVVNTAVLAAKALVDERIQAKTKLSLLAAGLYLSAPIDLLPEALFGKLGFLDDGLVIACALDQLLNHEDRGTVLSLWPGTDVDLARTQAAVGRAAWIVRGWVRPAVGRLLSHVLRIRRTPA